MLYDPKWDVVPTTKDILLKAADLIRDHGLVKNRRGSMEEGFCIHGAISMAAFSHPQSDDLKAMRHVVSYMISKGMDTHYNHNWIVAPWNNRPERTKEEVIALLEDAANAL